MLVTNSNYALALENISGPRFYYPFLIALLYSLASFLPAMSWLFFGVAKKQIMPGVFFESPDVFYKISFLFGAVIPTYFQTYLRERKEFDILRFFDFFLYIFLVNLRYISFIILILGAFAFLGNFPMSFYLVKSGLCDEVLAPVYQPYVLIYFLFGVPCWRVVIFELNILRFTYTILSVEGVLIFSGFVLCWTKAYIYGMVNTLDNVLPFTVFYITGGFLMLLTGFFINLLRRYRNSYWDFSLNLFIFSLLRAPLILLRLCFFTTLRIMYPSTVSSFPLALFQLQAIQEPYQFSIYSNIHLFRLFNNKEERVLFRHFLFNSYLLNWPIFLFLVISTNALVFFHYYNNPVNLFETVSLYIAVLFILFFQRTIVYIKCLPVMPSRPVFILEGTWCCFLILASVYAGYWGTKLMAWMHLTVLISVCYFVLNYLQKHYEERQTF